MDIHQKVVCHSLFIWHAILRLQDRIILSFTFTFHFLRYEAEPRMLHHRQRLVQHFATQAQALHPELRGLPVVVGGEDFTQRGGSPSPAGPEIDLKLLKQHFPIDQKVKG